MSNVIYQQYLGIIRRIDISETADEVFVDLIKSGKLKRNIQSRHNHLPSQIIYVAMLKIADQFKPSGTLVPERNPKNVMASIFQAFYKWFQKLTNFHTIKYYSYERKINKKAN